MKKRDKGTDVAELILKVQQQLTFLDKKVDALITQCSKPAEQPGRYYHRDHHQGPVRQESAFRERTMHKAVCADCSKECEVPFKPTGDRPVYCRECFAKRKHGMGHEQPRAPRPVVKAEEVKGGFDKFRRPDARKYRHATKKPALRRKKK